MKTPLMAFFAIVSAAASAANYDYLWDSASPRTSFGDGRVTLTLDGSSITSLVTAPGDGDTVITFGGDAMNFAAGATVKADRCRLAFTNDISAAGALNITGPVTGSTQPQWNGTGVGLLKGTPTAVLAWDDLGEVEVTGAHLSSGAGGEAKPYFVREVNGGVEMQLQQHLANSSTKVVKIRLEQSGGQIMASILYAKYVLGQDALGIDFDQPSDVFTIQGYNVCTADTIPQYYYGCDRLDFRLKTADSSVSVAGAFACAGKVSVEDSVTFGLVNQRGTTVATSSIGASDVLLVGAEGKGADSYPHYEYDGWQPANWNLFAANRSLSDIDTNSIAGKLGGTTLVSPPRDAEVCCTRWENGVLITEFQLKTSGSSYTKGVIVKFRQQGANVEFCPASVKYYEGEQGSQSFFEPNVHDGSNYAQSIDSGGYCVAGISADFLTPSFASSVILNQGGVAAAGGEIRVAGASDSAHAELRVTTKDGLPTNGIVRVGRNGIFSLICTTAEMNYGVSDGSCDIVVEEGGKFRQGGNADFTFSLRYNGQRVTIDGGEAEFGCECARTGPSSDPVDTSGSSYLNYLTLKNGARCYGKAVRLGNHNAKWTVGGTSPSVWDTDISLLAISGNGQCSVEFAVADVTESSAVDFTVTGDMKMFRPGQSDYKQLHINKTGAGTMRIDGETDFTAFPVDIQGGVWMVGAANTMSTAQNIMVSGGSFATADGVNAAVGRLLVDADGGVIAGANSAISFLDSSSEVWGGTVNITCPEGSSVRFGTSADGLSAMQKHRLRLNGKAAFLDENGYVRPTGLLIIFR